MSKEKEETQDEVKTDKVKEEKCMDEYTGPVSFSELDELQAAQEYSENVYRLNDAFSSMVFSIMRRSDIEDKETALSNLADEFASRVKTAQDEEKSLPEETWIDKAVEKFKELFTQVPPKEEEKQSFYIWKESTGQYKWLARYSNNIRDNDNPPEIIASTSHQRFVEMVDKGLYPLPELWLWHIKEWKWGEATSVAYDDAGFAVAMGTVDEGCEPIAEWAMSKELSVSHGMPPQTVKRDLTDKSIIIEHQTREISPLPFYAAANKRTGFSILKENEMAIPDEKKNKLISDGLSAEALAALEAKNQDDSKEAKEAGLETKEETPQQLTVENVAEVVSIALKPVLEQIQNLQSEVKELKETDATKIAKVASTTSQASIEAILSKQLPGLFNHPIDGRSKEAKSGPKETPVEETGLFFSKWMGGQQ